MENKALEMHKQWNGKLETVAKSKVKSREDLAIAYTPGVAEPCKVIAKDPEAAYTYTMKANTVAVVSDGSAVLGLGNIGVKNIIFLFLEFTGEVLRKLFDDCFVDLSFPRVPVTPPIIMLCFESPATTFGLVKATRLTAYLCYDP